MKTEYLSFNRLNKKYGKNIAFITPQCSLTFLELYEKTAFFSGYFQKMGITADTKVAILSKNSLEYVLSILSLCQIGAVAVPINIHNPSQQIVTQLTQINCTKLLLAKEFQSNNFPKQWKVFKIDNLLTGKLKPINLPTVDSIPLSQIVTVLFTSGSSGDAKAVVHTMGNHYFSALGSNLNIPLTPGNRWLVSLPLYHVGGLAIIFRTLLSGAATVIADEKDLIIGAILKYNISHLSLVPTQLMRLINEPGNIPVLRKLKAILLGGSSVPKALIDRVIHNDLPIYTSYGSTEMSSQITTTRPGDSRYKIHTAGKVLKYRRIKIDNDGEVLVRGNTLFKGYLVKNHINNAVIKNGWFPSGDIGQLKSDNYLTVLGRKDNMFVSGGENIHPEEIERELMQLDGVSDAIVVDIPDEIFGASPVAFIKIEANIPFERLALQNLLEEKIARFKIPKHIFKWPRKSIAMKPNRNELRKLALDKLKKKRE